MLVVFLKGNYCSFVVSYGFDIESEMYGGGGSIENKSREQLITEIVRAAATDATAITYGEPGTGKELVAQAIHAMSECADHRFVPVHCGAIPENLIESEFFGYKKGAFSGADNDRAGHFDFAADGAIFLDEIGEISLHMQIKLMRVIEGVGFTPVGRSQVKQSDTRIIAATNRGENASKAGICVRTSITASIYCPSICLHAETARKTFPC